MPLKEKTIEAIKKKYLKTYGYSPTDEEIFALYSQGALLLTDKQENELLKYFNF